MAISLILQFFFSAPLPQGGETGLIEEFDASLPRTGSLRMMMSPSQVLGPERAAELNHLLLSDEMIELFAEDVGAEIRLVDPGEEQELELLKRLEVEVEEATEGEADWPQRPPVDLVCPRKGAGTAHSAT